MTPLEEHQILIVELLDILQKIQNVWGDKRIDSIDIESHFVFNEKSPRVERVGFNYSVLEKAA